MSTIMAIEDNPTNQRLIRAVLERAGHIVAIIESAETALEKVGEVKPALILMDLQLPGLDGLALTRRLKADPATRDIPIVAVTAHALPGDREQAIAAGCSGYLSKPIDTRKFADQIAVYLVAQAG